MSDQSHDQDHVVVIVAIKKVKFIPSSKNPTSVQSQAARMLSTDGMVRQVGDVLQFSVTGTTVEEGVDRATKMMGVVDDTTPVTNLKHSDINGGAQR